MVLMPGARRAAFMLNNEGAALLEGAIYGSEVILACQAAATIGAEVVLADRSKTISNARLAHAVAEERLRSTGEGVLSAPTQRPTFHQRISS